MNLTNKLKNSAKQGRIGAHLHIFSFVGLFDFAAVVLIRLFVNSLVVVISAESVLLAG